jgi:hypothetical protein
MAECNGRRLPSAVAVIMSQIAVYQIYYDQATRAQVQPDFIPLDNTANPRPDWYEFWVILNFLRHNELKDDTWYAFLSPKFTAKTGFESKLVRTVLTDHARHANVVLLSPFWDQIFYFQNPWEQGEMVHPGITALTQQFLDHIGMEVNLQTLVTDLTTTVYSNYVFAKKPYWQAWQKLAEAFFQYVEVDGHLDGNMKTTYHSADQEAPMKTFIQERLASLVLATGQYEVVAFDRSANAEVNTNIFQDNYLTRKSLSVCDFMKTKYRATGDEDFLNMYRKLRAQIPFRPMLM